MLDDFGTGTTEEVFQLAGKRPSWIEMLNSLVGDGAMLDHWLYWCPKI